jgi:hypothetical protein
MATDDVPPPPATANRSGLPVTAKGASPQAIAKDTPPTAIDDVSPVIPRLPPSSKPAADYDGLTTGIVDDGDTSGQSTRPVRRPAKQSKLRQEPDRIEGQQSVDVEDEKLKRKLTICRGRSVSR